MAATGAPVAHEETIHGAGHAHPSDWFYIKTALFLALLTAIEVALFYVEDDLGTSVTIPLLLGLMVVKFGIVAALFMHLRFDSRLFTRLFLAGLILAVGVYLAAMTSMQFFGDDKTSELPESLPALVG